MSKKLGVAVLGGSFNPVTNAHVKIAEYLLANVPSISEVWFMPTWHHRFGKHEIYVSARKEMIELVTTPKIKYCGYEIDHKLRGGTFETLSQMLADPEIASKYELHFVIGSDCLLEFDQQWRNPEQLAKLVTFIIFPRQGYDASKYNGLLSKPPHQYLKNFSPLEISSSNVREKVRNGESIKGLVPEPVREFIEAKKIY
jgi:nicotinate-nucleotide adenylyltransferase